LLYHSNLSFSVHYSIFEIMILLLNHVNY